MKILATLPAGRKDGSTAYFGEMAEWLKAVVLKTIVG